MRRMPLLGAIAVAALLLAGCSQVAAIAPVGGTHLAEVRFASIDVLVDAGIALDEAPVCILDKGGTVECTGSATDGDLILVDSASDDPTNVTVTVGDEIVYHGAILDVLNKAAGAT